MRSEEIVKACADAASTPREEGCPSGPLNGLSLEQAQALHAAGIAHNAGFWFTKNTDAVDLDWTQQAVTFENELGRTISIRVSLPESDSPPLCLVQIAGPDTLHENLLTVREAEILCRELAAALKRGTAG